MANRSDIEAGKAHVSMSLKKDALVSGLKSVQGIVSDAGAKLMQVGAGVVAVGGSILGALGAAVASFAEIGGELADISARTGICAGALAELKFGAEQSGASLDDVEKSTKKLQQTLVDAADGSKSANAKIKELGLSLEELSGMEPDQQLITVGKAIAEIEDPAKRTSMALDILGKSGAGLIPMFAEIDELAAEARELGLVPTEQAVQDAAKIGDLWDKIKSVAMATVFEIGAALAPVLIPALETTVKIAAAISKWVRENSALVRTIAAVGAGLVVAGGVIMTIGAGLIAAGATISSVITIIGAIGPVLAAIFSPIGLIVGAIVAVSAALAYGVYYWARYTEAGQKTVKAIMDFFRPMIDFLKQAFQGLFDSFAVGNFGLAARIAGSAIKVAFFSAIDAILDRIMFIPKAIIEALRPIAELDQTGWLTGALDGAKGMLNVAAAGPGNWANDAKKDFDTLTAEAAAERAKAAGEVKPDKYIPGGGDPVAATVEKMKSFGSMNVTALTMQNWGRGKADPQAKMADLLDKIYQENVFGRKEVVKAIKEAAPQYGP